MSMPHGQAPRGRAQPASRGGGRGGAGRAQVRSAQQREQGRTDDALPARVGALAREWAPVAGRVLLGLVLGWFGYHELVQPRLWTGYVPLLSPTSSLAMLAVLAHGWVLLMLAVALVAGIATRPMAGVAAVVLAEIVISLTMTAGLSDLVLRDVGVLGLAVCLTGISSEHFALRR